MEAGRHFSFGEIVKKFEPAVKILGRVQPAFLTSSGLSSHVLMDSERFLASPACRRRAQNDNLKWCVILRGELCPEESFRRFKKKETFLAEVIAACEKCGG